MAGAEILNAAAGALGIRNADGSKGPRSAWFARDGLFAWIKGYSQEKVGNSVGESGRPITPEFFGEEMKSLSKKLDTAIKDLGDAVRGNQPRIDLDPLVRMLTDIKTELERNVAQSRG